MSNRLFISTTKNRFFPTYTHKDKYEQKLRTGGVEK